MCFFIIQCNSGNNVNLGLGRMGSEITDDTVEPLAFAVCNTDGVEGLSWVEVEQCEVSKSKYCISANQCPQKLFFFEFGLMYCDLW